MAESAVVGSDLRTFFHLTSFSSQDGNLVQGRVARIGHRNAHIFALKPLNQNVHYPWDNIANLRILACFISRNCQRDWVGSTHLWINCCEYSLQPGQAVHCIMLKGGCDSSTYRKSD